MRYKKQILNNKGMTLIEVVVATLIFSIVSLMIYSAIASGANIISISDKNYSNINHAFSDIENGEFTDIVSGEINFKISGVEFETIGDYVTVTSNDKTTSLTQFTSEDLGSQITSFRQKMVDFYSLSDYELITLGLDPRHLSNNSSIHNLIYRLDYESKGNTWDKFDTLILNDYGIKNGVPTELYIQPYLLIDSNGRVNQQEELIVFASPISGSWYANLIYNHEDEKWYWIPNEYNMQTYPNNPERWTMSGKTVTTTWSKFKSNYIDTGKCIPIDKYA